MLLALSLLLNPAAAATLSVCESGCDYSDIQDAVKGAASGDVLELERKTWSLQPFTLMDIQLTIRPQAGGDDPLVFDVGRQGRVSTDEQADLRFEEATFTSSMEGTSGFHFHVYDSTLTLVDCSIKSIETSHPLIWIQEGTAVLARTRIKGNITEGGALRAEASKVTMSSSSIINNTSSKSSTAGGITLTDSNEVKLKRTKVMGNSGPAGGVLLLHATTTLILNGSTVSGNHGNSSAGGIDNAAGGTVHLWKESTITDNSSGPTIDPGYPQCLNVGADCTGS